MSAELSPGNSFGGHRPPLQKIILGSRGSELARRQTAMVADALKRVRPKLETTVKIIQTQGDERTAEPLDPRAGRKGLFTGEIERALSGGEIDLAVHSAKDLPSETTSGLELAGVLERAAINDVLISKQPGNVLRPEAVVATGSVRRQHQLRYKQPGIEVIDLRGNVPTRLRKLVTGDWDGIVLARAGVERLGHDLARGSFEFEGTVLHAQVLATDDFLSAGGQGVIALQVRSDDDEARTIVRAINNGETFLCLEAEREFLRLLQGDCGSPVGVLATISGSAMRVRAQVFEPPRIEPRIARVEGEAPRAKQLARELWEAING